MECNHLEEALDISPAFIKRLIDESRDRWSCSKCRSNNSPWMCLKCGLVLCGRYVKAHCKSHSEQNTGHNVCINDSLMVFCYTCDDFVINDTHTSHIQLIRTSLETEQKSRVRKRQCTLEVGSLFGSQSPIKKKLRRSSKENKYGTSHQRFKTVGLRNLGNTCFMNAILQSLSNLKQFSCYFKELPAIEINVKADQEAPRKYCTRSYKSDDKSLVEELRKVLCALWQGGSKAISPDSLFSVVWKVVPRFRGYQQHDAHEFMLYLLDCVHSELLLSEKFNNRKDTIVTGIFGGQLQSELACLKCGAISSKQEPYLDLSLDIPMKKSTLHRQHSPQTKQRRVRDVCHLEDCLQRFVALENLAESEWYLCSKCKMRQPSTKKFWLLRLPNVLVLHLKRFRYSALSRSKVDTFVRFPVKNLDMNPYLLKSAQRSHRVGNKAHMYDLAAAVVHHGSGAGSGHYIAYARHEGIWYNFNDSTVSPTTEDSIVHCKGYILFYTRQYPDVSIMDRINGGLRFSKRLR